MFVFEFLAGVLAVLALVPVCALFTQVLFSVGGRRAPAPRRGTRPTIAVLVPAHNEELLIAATLYSVRRQLGSNDRLLVVADNCTDGTASVARQSGASVVTREDRQRIGKNYALEFGINELSANPPAVVIVVDADCRVDDGAIDRLARECGATQRPVQSLYLMLAPAGAGLGTQIASFAWIVRNWVRPLGMNGMGLPCHLMGSGMAIPWTRVGDLGSTGATIVEDYKAGIRMALAGAFSVFCPDARVISYFPEKQAAAAIQRTRWEHGHLQLILDEVPVLLLTAVRRRDLRLLGLALDLAIPPLALVALMSGTAVLLAAAAALSGAAWWPLAIAIGNACILCAAVLLAWYSRGREAISLSSMLSVPAYMLAKVPLYLRFLTKRQKIWVKTDRN